MRNIASERVRIGLSQSELAERLGVTRVTVARWESGISTPGSSMIVALADIFKCSTDYIYGRSDERAAIR